ncbi:hypothetical protein QQS21_004580 [Conoideocrella luteorostrata]|uniref:Zn(2)-C6 fungal-type domain-containing protein n=1 Tax=Conoideocrella luteorostrata TaxID=1105319 RepID=A0AAJ0CR47_9HYPO|nr:hypothetical protein QQS21_004580 [Conoideocrella luteorostrata]
MSSAPPEQSSEPPDPRVNGSRRHATAEGDGQPQPQYGTACVRCRAKKLKCDSQRPRCGTCTGSNAVCEVAAPQVQRGPKKGYLKTLQNKIATLEKQLAEAQGAMLPVPDAPPPQAHMPHPHPELDFLSMDTMLPDIPDDFHYNSATASGLASCSSDLSLDPLPLPHPMWAGFVLTSAGPIPANPFQSPGSGSENNSGLIEAIAPSPGVTEESFYPTKLLQSDLNQVYFERTHQSVPILQRRQYFSWAHSASKTPARKCLQYAMWTSAASLSSHLQPLQESLYQTTQRLLTASNDNPDAAASIEYVQARILMSIHDFVHRSHCQGWISAGQCFRIVQLMRLHQLDDPLQPEKPHEHDGWIHLEEKRRAFWMAYCLDVLRATRLPLSDDAFQNDEPCKIAYLHDLFEAPAEFSPSPFLELIIFCTISRNIASLKRVHLADSDKIAPTPSLFSHHASLSSTLEQRTEALQTNHSPSLHHSDPILLFTRMFAHALNLCLCSCLKKTLSRDAEDYHEQVLAWQHRALKAVFGIVGLAESIASLSYFKMHPFTPLPLGICRDFLKSGQWVDQSTESQIQELSHLLCDMSSINNVAQDYLAECESQAM